MDVKRRIEKWDILKFVLIFFVVLGHFADSFINEHTWMKSAFLFIYTFHMPAFVFVSGLFSKKTVNEKRYDKAFSFLIMFFVTKFLIFIFRLISTGEPLFSAFSEGGLPWYMLAMFVFPLITIFVRNFSPKYILIFSVILACLVGYDEEISLLFSASRIIVYFPFYYIGYVCDIKKTQRFFENKVLKLLSVIVLVIFAFITFGALDSCYWLRPLLTGKNPYSLLGDNAQFGGLLRLGYYAVATLVSGAVICLIPNHLGRGTVARMGSRSLQVYALQYLVIFPYIMYIGNSFLPSHPILRIFILTVITTLLFSMKFWQPVFNAIMVPKPRKNTKEKI